MKKLLLIIALTISLAPNAVFADPAGGPAYVDDTCSTTSCECYLLGTRQTNFPDLKNEVECQDACVDRIIASTSYTEDYVTTKFYCDGTLKPYSEGTPYVAAAPAKQARKPIFPCLNVPLPGLNQTRGTEDIMAAASRETGYNLDTGIKKEKCTWNGIISSRSESNLLGEYVKALYSYLLGAATVVALTFLMIGGVQYALSRGDTGMLGKAKDRIKNAITGLVLLLLAYNIAFLIDPGTVLFQPLNVETISREDFPPGGEDVDVKPNLALSGIAEPIQNEPYIHNATGGDTLLDPDALEALRTVAQAYSEATSNKHKLVVTSAGRDIAEQSRLFYNNCLANSSKTCKIPTCNPARGSTVISDNQPYVLKGELAGVTDSATIISKLAEEGKFGNCPHTSMIAVDAWGDPASTKWVHDPSLQAELIKLMTENGFCRLGSEPWHFEFGQGLSTACSAANSTGQYTRSGATYTPPGSCVAWNYEEHYCVATR